MSDQQRILQLLQTEEKIQDLNVGRLDLQARTFERPVVFEHATFKERATFTGCQFLQGARFFDCCFEHAADFDRCRFERHAYFWRSRFVGEATFLDSTIKPQRNEEQPGSIYPGEANFSWATFCSRACFYRTRFQGPAYFWRTVFRDQANFGESTFDAATLFAGAMHEVCLSRHDWGDDLFEEFLSRGLLSPDQEKVDVFQDQRTRYWYGQFTGIKSERQLRDRLEQQKFAENVREKVVEKWREHARPMFAGGEHDGGDFTNAHFGKPDEVHIRDVNVSECRFAHCDLTKVRFGGVTWDSQPAPFGLTRRAVRDERDVNSSGEYLVVSRLYRQLRKNDEEDALYEEAGEFHFGEMEMQRLAQQGAWRYVSLLACYRWLSGYGQQTPLALCWLLCFVLVLFPALTLLAGVTSNVPHAVLRSLEVCTFLESSGDVPIPAVGRFIDGFERILVGLQAGLFLVTIKRRFGRN